MPTQVPGLIILGMAMYAIAEDAGLCLGLQKPCAKCRHYQGLTPFLQALPHQCKSLQYVFHEALVACYFSCQM